MYFVYGFVAEAAVETGVRLAAHGEGDGDGGVAACFWAGGLTSRDCLGREGRHIKRSPRISK
jgi:hypothetical protein